MQPRNERVPANRHFTFHAVVSVGGVYYDPSYGRSGPLPDVLEQWPSASPQTGSSVPLGVDIHEWLCPHPYEPLLDYSE